MRVVFDSNIIISAIIFPGSQADTAMQRILDRTDTLLLSKVIIREILRVLAAKFSKNAEELSRVAVTLSEMSEIQSPVDKISVLADEPDNRILECAVAGKADMIVTGDKKMLAIKEYKGIPVVALRTYLDGSLHK